MVVQVYTEEKLLKKKYAELLKIGKSLGLKCARVKTGKLIEDILAAQDAENISKEAASVADALVSYSNEENANVNTDKDTANASEDELLADVQFPEVLSPENEEETEPAKSDRSQGLASKITDTQIGKGKKRRHTETVDVKKTNTESTASVTNAASKRQRSNTFEVDMDDSTTKTTAAATNVVSKRRRTNTYEVDTDDSTTKSTPAVTNAVSKRRRTNTYEVDTDDSTTKSTPAVTNAVSKRRRTGTFEVDKTDAMQEDNANVDVKVSGESGAVRRRTSTFELDKAGNSQSDAPDVEIKTVENNGHFEKLQQKLVSSSATSGGSKEPDEQPHQDSNMNKTAETADKNKISRLKRSLSQRVSHISSPAPAGKRQRLSNVVESNAPQNGRKSVPDSKIVKPKFTVGRTDSAKNDNKGQSNIPRFVSYARKLKVPSFAKIHEKAFKRMEALDEYVQRKRHVSGTVGSGSATKKPQGTEEVFKPSVTATKNINFNFAGVKSPATVAKRTPPMNKSKKHQAGNTSVVKTSQLAKKSPKPTAKPVGVLKSPKSEKQQTKTPANAKKVTIKTKTPKKSLEGSKPSSKVSEKSPRVSVGKNLTSTRKSPRSLAVRSFGSAGQNLKSSAKKLSPTSRPSALPRLLKENMKPEWNSFISPAGKNAATPGSVHKRVEYDPKEAASKPLNYIPYKGAIKPFKAIDKAKSLVEKNPNIKSRQQIREGQKKILKGVRINKRFELQMANRGINM